MSWFQIIWSHIEGSSFRSVVIVLCAALMAGFSTAATLLISGAQDSLRLTLDRLGADVIVVPEGSAPVMENAFLMGVPTKFWMPHDILDELRSVPGVTAASPQLYLSTLRGATCCSVPDMLLIAYEPETDFTLKPWLDTHIKGGLQEGDVVGGHFVYVPADQDRIYVYGYGTNLRGNLEATGTGLDQSMFFTFETAYEIAQLSAFQAEQPMEIPEGRISSILIKVADDADAGQVAKAIRSRFRDVSVVENANLFQSQRSQILNLLRSITVLLGIGWVLSMALIGFIFSLVTNERRREIGVLQALGATRRDVFKTILSEGALLAACGGIGGILLYVSAILLFKNLIVRLLALPFFVPSPWIIAGWGLAALTATILSVLLSAFIPALRISRMDPAVAMRE